MLETFPRSLFSNPISQTEGLAVEAALTTTSNTRDRLKDMQEFVNRAMGSEEREAVANDLAELAVQYEHGWNEDSDSGQDD